MCLTALQVFYFYKVPEIFIISNNLDYIPGTFKVIVLILKGFYNCKKFPIISTIITLNPGKLPGLKRHRVLVLLGTITSLVLL